MNSRRAAFFYAYNDLCDKMQKEYKEISKSTEPKEAIIKKIDELCWGYEREYDNLIFIRPEEGINWNEVRKGFNIDKDRFTNLKLKLQGRLCSRCQKYLKESGSEYCYDCRVKVWDEDKKKRQKQWKKQKLSHCNYCQKKSSGKHYIYDLTTKMLEPSNNNASDPDNQWLFCSEEHFEKWHKKNYFTCAECLKENYTGNWKYNKNKKDGQKFCSDNCFYRHYAETCDDCQKKCITSYQDKATGYARTYYSDGINKTGTICGNCRNKKLREEKEANRENCKICSKKLPYNHYYSLCSVCLDKQEEEQKKDSQEEEDNEQEIRYCKYCSTKLEEKHILGVCDKEECILKLDKEVYPDKYRERERERE
ncbi:MAG: hypothetical protein MRERV_90c003, partial [Mycoplasmataceae bacterium RV_VA103A]